MNTHNINIGALIRIEKEIKKYGKYYWQRGRWYLAKYTNLSEKANRLKILRNQADTIEATIERDKAKIRVKISLLVDCYNNGFDAIKDILGSDKVRSFADKLFFHNKFKEGYYCRTEAIIPTPWGNMNSMKDIAQKLKKIKLKNKTKCLKTSQSTLSKSISKILQIAPGFIVLVYQM